VRRFSVVVLGLALLAGFLLVRALRKDGQNATAGPTGPTPAVIPPSNPAAAAPRGPDPVPVAARPEIDAKALFDRLFEDYRKVIAGGGAPPSARFPAEAHLRLREARLLALSAPEAVMPLARALAVDPSRSVHERLYGVRLLGFLAEEGHAKADSALLEIAQERERDVALGALYQLADRDAAGAHRALYERKAVDGAAEAFDLLSFWPDTGVRGWAAKLGASADQNLRFVGAQLNERLDVLQAPDSASRIERLIAVGDGEGDEERWAPWAIKAAKVTSLPTLKEALRRRLDATFNAARDQDRRRKAGLTPDPDRPSFEDAYVRSATFTGLPDPVYDDALLELARLGGPLNELERARCRHAGYLCDPRERLAELMSERR